MPKVLDPDQLTSKRPSSNVQDYLAPGETHLNANVETGEVSGAGVTAQSSKE